MSAITIAAVINPVLLQSRTDLRNVDDDRLWCNIQSWNAIIIFNVVPIMYLSESSSAASNEFLLISLAAAIVLYKQHLSLPLFAIDRLKSRATAIVHLHLADGKVFIASSETIVWNQELMPPLSCVFVDDGDNMSLKWWSCVCCHSSQPAWECISSILHFPLNTIAQSSLIKPYVHMRHITRGEDTRTLATPHVDLVNECSAHSKLHPHMSGALTLSLWEFHVWFGWLG